MPKISIIIPTYNCCNSIGEALESIFKQNMQDFEIIIVDDGSKDNTKAVISKYNQYYPEFIRYFYQENQGAGSARNKGIQESKGEYIVFLDADDLLLPESLRLRNDFLDKNQSVSLVFSDYYVNKEQISIYERTKFKDFFKDSFYLNKSGLISNDKFLVKFLQFSPHPIWTSTVMLRRKIIDEVGFFRIDLSNCQDLDLFIRIIRRFRVGYIERQLSIYRHDLSQNTKRTEKHFTCLIKVYKELMDLNVSAEINKILKKNISDSYFHFAYYYRQLLILNNARKYFLFCIIYNPFQYRGYKSLMVTFLPIKLQKYILKYIGRFNR